MEVKVYSTQICPWCIKAKEFLKEHKIKFEEFDVAEDENARAEMIDISGQMGVPVIDVDGEIVIGFDKEKLKKLLKIK